MTITVGHLVGAGIGLVGGGIALGMMRGTAEESPGSGVASILGGAASITFGLMLPSGPAKLAFAGIGIGLVLGGGLGLRDALQGAIDTKLQPVIPEQ